MTRGMVMPKMRALLTVELEETDPPLIVIELSKTEKPGMLLVARLDEKVSIFVDESDSTTEETISEPQMRRRMVILL
jgi:hypothetical protein